MPIYANLTRINAPNSPFILF